MQFDRSSIHSSGVARCPSVIDVNIGADDPTMPLQGVIKSAHAGLVFRVLLSAGNEHADMPLRGAAARAPRAATRPPHRRAA